MLAGFGLVVGAGTVLVVAVAVARVAFLPPPQAVQESVRVQGFLERVRNTLGEDLVIAVGPCPDRAGSAICIHLGGKLDELDPRRRGALREQLRVIWQEVAEEPGAARRLLLLDARGSVI